MGDGFGVAGGGPSSWTPRGWSWMDSGSGSGSDSGSDSGIGAGEGDFCLTGGALDGPARELDFPEVDPRVLAFNEATSAADISTISESSSDTTTGFLPLRAGFLLGFSDGTAALDGSGLGGAEDLADLRVGTGTSSTSSSSPSLTTTETLARLVLAEALEPVADRPFCGGGSCCIVSSLTVAGSSLATPRLRFTGGGESSTDCSSSSVSGTPLRTVFDRAEARVREATDGGLVVREGGFSTISLVASPSTSDRPRFLRDVEAFSSDGTADADRVARRGGMGGSGG